MSKNKFKLITIDGEEVEINIKDIVRLHTNEVVVSTNYFKWLKTGKFSDTSYFLGPENLDSLVHMLEGLKLSYRMSHELYIESSKLFLEYYPTTDIYNKKIEERKNIPFLD
ncbi:MAG: hypothetical protein RBQ97_09735 [Acholeplasma sp.]|nr:hypothetical protein [Acholeplasma sp.]